MSLAEIHPGFPIFDMTLSPSNKSILPGLPRSGLVSLRLEKAKVAEVVDRSTEGVLAVIEERRAGYRRIGSSSGSSEDFRIISMRCLQVADCESLIPLTSTTLGIFLAFKLLATL